MAFLSQKYIALIGFDSFLCAPPRSGHLKAQLIREVKVSSACWESDDFSKAGVEEVAEVQPKLMGARTWSILNAHIYQAVAG